MNNSCMIKPPVLGAHSGYLARNSGIATWNSVQAWTPATAAHTDL